MEKAWSRCRGGGADNKKITFIFQNEPFLLLTGYLEFHFRSQGKSGKSQGIPSWKKSGNPAPVLSRVLGKIVVLEYIYSAILRPYQKLSFSYQFAFRPSGSTTAAIIFILQKITWNELLLEKKLLGTNTHVVVYAFDFSKALDTE